MPLTNLFHPNQVYQLYATLDLDNDHRLDLAEFKAGLELLGLGLGKDDAEAEFRSLDANGGGYALFDEFCVWYAPFTIPPFFGQWGKKPDFVCLVATMPGRHSGDHIVAIKSAKSRKLSRHYF